MKQIPYFLPLCIFLAALLEGKAQTNSMTLLTLGQAEESALRNHPRISMSELRALAAHQVMRAARSAYFPNIVANVTAAGSAGDNTRIAAGGLSNPIIFSRNAEGVTASQLITDFGRTGNLTESSRLHARAEEENTEATRAQIVLQVAAGYFGALEAQSVLRVARETVSTRQLLVDQVSALASNNLKSELDVSFARVALEEGRLLLSKSENDLEASYATLSTLLGVRDQTSYVLVEELLSTNAPSGLSGLVQEALRYRPEILRLRFERDSALKFARAEKALHYPTISAVASAGVIPIGDERLPEDYAAAGVNLSLPLFSGMLHSARQKEAELKARAAEEALRDEENSVIRDVRVAWLNTNNALDRLRITEVLLANARQGFRLAQARYEAGSSSIIELSAAQLNATSAEIANATARYGAQVQQAALEYQIGAKWSAAAGYQHSSPDQQSP